MKLKTLIQINEWISHGIAVNRTPDSKLRATPGGQNDGAKGWNEGVGDWDGIIEGKDWFCYVEGNDWHSKMAGASIYITEDDKPHKMWVKFKTHGLRKAGDTNESFKERVRKHSHKVARSWMTAAKDIHNNVGLNEVGNPIPITWKQAFKEALNSPKVKGLVAEVGENELPTISDPVNFTPRIGEIEMKSQKISYSAVVLEKRDHEKLLEFFKESFPQDWSQYAHHMTIKMGELPPENKQDIGKEILLTAYEFGKSDMAVAVKVKGYWTTNQIAHITLAINKNEGGKPVDSNNIIKWEPLVNTIPLHGIVTEIPFK